MANVPTISFHEYLLASRRDQKNQIIIEEYDDFLLKVWEFFELRAAAEDYFAGHRYLAKSIHGALPLPWERIHEVLVSSGPQETLITQIAKRRYAGIETLIRNLRKVLSRVRQKVPLGRVQQIDAHCLRWLTRQPGVTAVEKGGSRQEILGVVRLENYDTLENRVLKDFLLRAAAAANLYLKTYGTKFSGLQTIKAVARFRNLCLVGLSLPELENVRSLIETPQPNFVLQQDAHYSKVWYEYCRLVRQDEVAERLWKIRDQVGEDYRKCVEGIPLHCSVRAKYRAAIWFNELDGLKPLLDLPYWDNELAPYAIIDPMPPRDDVVVVDLVHPWDGRDRLLTGRHTNAYPYIQNPHCENREPIKEETLLAEIVRRHDKDGLRNYFRHLHGLLGGKRWVVLVADNWDAGWLDQVKNAAKQFCPDVFLLWRSIAAVLGSRPIWGKAAIGSTIIVADGPLTGEFLGIKFKLFYDEDAKRLVPQRASCRLHPERFRSNVLSRTNDFLEFAADCPVIICAGKLTKDNFLPENGRFFYHPAPSELLRDGVKAYLADQARGITSYYDELETLAMITQNAKEEVEAKFLVKGDSRWPGGKVYTGPETRGGTLGAGEKKLSLYLFEGRPTESDLLKLYEEMLQQDVKETTAIYFRATVTPGQGLANVTFNASFLKKPIPLDLALLKNSSMTQVRIERELKRHFPPTMPFVEASPDIWEAIKNDVNNYMVKHVLPPGDLFAKAQNYWGPVGATTFRKFGRQRDFDETTMSPIDRLKRENVFGNNPDNRLPDRTREKVFSKLFKNLVQDYRSIGGGYLIRVLAWTYQYDNPSLEPVRRTLFHRYVELGNPLLPQEYTFCSNNFDEADNRLEQILERAFSHVIDRKNEDEELRLIYNILQFYPLIVSSCATEKCEATMVALFDLYNSYAFFDCKGRWNGKGAVKMAGYLLKCMLFLLHKRRSDTSFFRQKSCWHPEGFLDQPLPPITPTLRVHEQTRQAFIKYVNGNGTLDGIPNS